MTEAPNIFLLDDDDDVRLLYANMISYLKLGQVHSMSTYAELLTRLESGVLIDQPISLLVVDYRMPDIDGLEVCRRLRSHSLFQDLPIIMLTSSSDEEVLEAAFDSGVTDFIHKPATDIELKVRIRSALQLRQEQIERQIREQELLDMTQWLVMGQQESKKLIFIDELTEVYNRRAFNHKLSELWSFCFHRKHAFSALMVDIDHFKRYNDTYGHPAGDRCLLAVAQCMKKSLGAEFLARYGGEEFAVLLPRHNLASAQKRAEKLRAAIENLDIPEQEGVTISVGAATVYPHRHQDRSTLMSLADKALYRAKEAGRNGVASETGNLSSVS